ncbi:MFS transporter [Niallia endozanthoxylica]|uniref:MFS transporter n=1 Tax=Niallia endozanthoxylica TaxID=2036016 RepID=A0A5J5I2M6_9BACI|nr:MFS transporter [Niallia endozanthoxylica]
MAGLPAFLEGFDYNVFAFSSPAIIESIQAPIAMLGLLTTGQAVGAALFSIVGGFAFDRLSVKNTILISVALFSVFTFVSGFVSSLTLLIIARLFVGIGIGMFQAAILSFLGDIFYEKRGSALSTFSVFYGGGMFVGPYLVSAFLPNYHTSFIVTGITSLITLILIYLFIPKTYKQIEKQKFKMKELLNKNVILISIASFFYGVTLFAFLGFSSQYFLNELSIPSGQAATIFSMYGIAGVIISFPLGMLADKFGAKRVFILTALFILIGSIGLFSVGSNILLLGASALIMGAGVGLPGFAVAIGQNSVGEHMAGTVSGWILFMFGVGQIFGGPLFSVLLPLGFVNAGLISLGLPILLCVILSLFISNGSRVSLKSKQEYPA